MSIVASEDWEPHYYIEASPILERGWAYFIHALALRLFSASMVAALSVSRRCCMTVERIRIGWDSWLLWVLITTIGWTLGFFIGFILADVVGDIFESGLLVDTIFGAVLASMVGVLQRFFLPVQVPRAGRWVLASTAGFALAFAGNFVVLGELGSFVELLDWTVVAAFGGAVTGILQWLVLRGQVSRAGWWVLASTVGWGLSMAVVGALEDVGVGAFSGAPVGGVVLGVVTGAALVWLLRQPLPET
jgi:hypothetical protein